MDAGPPLLSENANVVAAASHEHCSKKEKLIEDEELIYRCEGSATIASWGYEHTLSAPPAVSCSLLALWSSMASCAAIASTSLTRLSALTVVFSSILA
jgi:hypothetical protein